MVDIKDTSEKQLLKSIEDIEQYISLISVSNFQSGVPRVNFKKIKLNKFQNLYTQFKSKDLSNLDLSDDVKELGFPLRYESSQLSREELFVNPLRKKVSDDERPPVFNTEDYSQEIRSTEQVLENLQTNESDEESEGKINDIQEPVLKQKKSENVNNITFNLEAQILQEEENVVLAPELPSTPEIKQDLISSSGEQSSFVWPPVSEKKKPKAKDQKPKQVKKKKKKSYFLSEQSNAEKKTKFPEAKPESPVFPWNLEQENNLIIESEISGGLESELLDIPESTIVKQPLITPTPVNASNEEVTKPELVIEQPIIEEPKKKVESVPFTGPIVYKAVLPKIPFESLSESRLDAIVKDASGFSKMLDRFNKLEFGIVETGKGEKKVGKMFDKNGYKLTPIRIVIIGGALATLGYSAWNYLLPIINSNNTLKEKDKVVVKNLFKPKSHLNKDNLKETNEQDMLQMSNLVDGSKFSPITQEERLALIQMARESVEGRLDPFGQEEVLPREVVEKRKEELKDTGPTEFSVSRKQVELVGVISSNNKNLALVNVYNADYTITEDDDKATKESKLKTALSMAVPNRLEVSLLDPVEDWYVKMIVKGKVKGDDPMIELVKEDKKFKLKVGQKLLLPEEKEPVATTPVDKSDSPKS